MDDRPAPAWIAPASGRSSRPRRTSAPPSGTSSAERRPAGTHSEATLAERRAVERLTEGAQKVLAADGRPATRQLDRVAATLRAAAVTDEGRMLLETGRFTAELEPPGSRRSAPRWPAGPAPPRKPAQTGDELAARRRQREEKQRLRELQVRARAAERFARDAERDAERADAAAAKARRVAEKARADAEAAAAALTDA